MFNLYGEHGLEGTSVISFEDGTHQIQGVTRQIGARPSDQEAFAVHYGWLANRERTEGMSRAAEGEIDEK